MLKKLNMAVGRHSDDVGMQVPLSGDVFLPKSRALSYLYTSKRTVYDYEDGWDDDVTGGGGQRGLACECCVNRCTYDEMIEYCQRPSVRKRLALPDRSLTPVRPAYLTD